jgi:hypothetical protein
MGLELNDGDKILICAEVIRKQDNGAIDAMVDYPGRKPHDAFFTIQSRDISKVIVPLKQDDGKLLSQKEIKKIPKLNTYEPSDDSNS